MTGRIDKALSGFYYVDTGDALLTCKARGKFRKTGQNLLGHPSDVLAQVQNRVFHPTGLEAAVLDLEKVFDDSRTGIVVVVALRYETRHLGD